MGNVTIVQDLVFSLDVFAALLTVILLGLILGKAILSGGGLNDIVISLGDEGVGEKRSLLNQRIARRHA